MDKAERTHHIFHISIIIVLSAIVAILIMVPTVCDDDSDGAVYETFVQDGIKYCITSENPYTVQVYKNSYSCSSLTIPSSVTYSSRVYSVKSIGSYAFENCTNLKSITLPESMTGIGGYAFQSCSSLTSITWGENLTSISGGAFSYCTGLIAVDIPSNVTSIGTGAFSYCSELTSVTLPEKLTDLESNVFLGCTALKELNYNAATVTALKEASEVFYDAGISGDGISINFGSKVSSIPKYLFYVKDSAHSPKIIDLCIPSNVGSIGDYAFGNCKTLSTVDYDANYCSDIKGTSPFFSSGSESGLSVTIGENVSSVPKNMFNNTGISTLTISKNVKSIGEYSFAHCKKLSSLNYDVMSCTVSNYIFYDSGTDAGFDVIFGKDVSAIPDNLFMNASGIRTVTFSDSIESIGKYSFYYCVTLSSVSITDNITKIGEYAFSNCSNLTSVVLPDTINSMGQYAFQKCTKLTSFTIPNTSVALSKGLLSGCTGITDVTMADSVTDIGVLAFEGCSSMTSIVLPDKLSTIGSSAFKGCTSLTSMILPATITTIGTNVFNGCTGLTTVTVPDNMQSIPGGTFYGCSSLQSFDMPTKLVSIGPNSFYGCSEITSIVIPETVTSIGDSAFASCAKLKDIYYNAEWCTDLHYYAGLILASSNCMSIHFGDFVKRVPANLFHNHVLGYYPQITNVYFSDSIESIGENAFCGNLGVSKLELPINLKVIEDYAFSSCEIYDIEMPSTVTRIGQYAFSGCYGLWDVTIPGSVSTIEQGCFSTSHLHTVVISEGVTTVKKDAFYNCSFLHSIKFSRTVTDIDSEAFGSSKVFYDMDGVTVMSYDTLHGHLFRSSDDYPYKNMVNQTPDLCTIRFATNAESPGGYADTSGIDNIPSFSKISIDGDKLTVNGTTVSVVVYPVDGKIITFDHWSVEDGTLVESNMWILLSFRTEIVQCTLTYMNDGVEHYKETVDYGTVITPPNDPIRQSTENYDYRFNSWYGHTEGEKAVSDKTFTAYYDTYVKKIDTSGAEVKIEAGSNSGSVVISSAVMDQIKAAANEGKSLEVNVPNGTISIDAESAQVLNSGEQKVSIIPADVSKMSESIRHQIEGRPLYSINFGDNHNFENKIIVKLNYTLKDGEKADELRVWYITIDGSHESYECTYADGAVSFETDHLSDFAIVTETSVPVSDSSSGVLIAALIVLVIVAVLAFFLFKALRSKNE